MEQSNNEKYGYFIPDSKIEEKKQYIDNYRDDHELEFDTKQEELGQIDKSVSETIGDGNGDTNSPNINGNNSSNDLNGYNGDGLDQDNNSDEEIVEDIVDDIPEDDVMDQQIEIPGDVNTHDVEITCDKDSDKDKKLCCYKGSFKIDTVQLFPADVIDKDIIQSSDIIHENICSNILSEDNIFMVKMVKKIADILDLEKNRAEILKILSLDEAKVDAAPEIKEDSKCQKLSRRTKGGMKFDKEFNDGCIDQHKIKIKEKRILIREFIFKQIYKEYDKRYFLNFLRKIKTELDELRGTINPSYFIYNGEYESIHGKVFAEGVKEYANMYVDEGRYLKYSGMNIDEITQKLIEDAENEISAEMDSPDIDNPFEDPNY